ncbi:D-alanine-D-alanine ligase-like ATP-grasp enzyme [Actinoplanes lutulentus]|uniref:D-Ala-D-Ala ligase-like protein n=1 Tax=Actinoplanes lutulentus TaxID=1287878 RepID=A0A327ZJR5_9ACTN|nr:hypothetical protein [Actinoplanes lutulentus]MBB2940577.1 D-alanine-D-alanine ligase-like ATP-grasp enzyme [Actinoplanes lutulentus]RAK42889.1 D-Ala-D-Ala ligase-like protein [Actinoplanes lutulentus]
MYQSVRVAVLFGGQNTKHAVSVVTNLDRSRYRVIPVRIAADGRWSAGFGTPDGPIDESVLRLLTPDHPPGVSVAESLFATIGVILREADLVFPVLHGVHGEDGTVQNLLDQAGIRYVGNPAAACATAMDTALTRRILTARGIAADGAVIGRDIDVGVLETPDGHLIASAPRETGDLAVPAGLDQDTTARLKGTAVRVFRELGCAGMLHVGFVVAPDSTVSVKQVSTMPGMASGSRFPLMWTAGGISYTELLDILIRTARRGKIDATT